MRIEAEAVGAMRLRLYGPPETPPKSRVSPAFGRRYASGVTSTFASCFAKWAFALSAASAGTIHEVFLASTGRGNSLRRYVRRTLASMPISSASALGVSGASDMVPLSLSREPFVHRGNHIMTGRAFNVKGAGAIITFPLHLSLPRHTNVGSPPSPPVKDRRPHLCPWSRAKRAKPEIFCLLKQTAYEAIIAV